MVGFSASRRRRVSAWVVLMRRRRCSGPSTVNIERSTSIMPISGHCLVTVPDCHSDQALMSLTSLVSASSCLASV
ncbi:Uncharacterised protein [Mycobacteroides abscessus subsp. abscessus]|nr:Uncharacterised protein [Mycobacteroides abscessus subsp. abscessus]